MARSSGGGNRCITSHNHGFRLFKALKGSPFYSGVLGRFFALLRMTVDVTLNLIQSLSMLVMIATSLRLQKTPHPIPVLNLLHAHRIPQKWHRHSLFHLLAIRTRYTPSVRKFALPQGAREKISHVEATPKHRMVVKLEKFNFLKNKNRESVVNLKLTNKLDSFAFAQNDHNNNSLTKKEGNNFTDTDFSRFTFHFSLEQAVNNQNSKVAFTLAEVLITLGVIGVVAALTLPAIMENITERINSSRQANVANKITEAMDHMKSQGALATSYASTDAFVDELQKYIKVAKRCDASHIAECWPTPTVTTSDGDEVDVSKAKTGKNLNIKNNTTNNVGLILADGAALILTYNQDFSGIDEGDAVSAVMKDLPVGFGKSKEFAYTSSVTAPIDFVMDINGQKGPNSETINNKMHDIRSFKAARFSKGCAGVEIPGIGCIVNLGSSYECVSGADKDKWDKDGRYTPSC